MPVEATTPLSSSSLNSAPVQVLYNHSNIKQILNTTQLAEEVFFKEGGNGCRVSSGRSTAILVDVWLIIAILKWLVGYY